MASVRKRKMARSSVKKNTRKEKDKHRKIRLIPHPAMAAHWNTKLTWKQNYDRFGLQASISKFTVKPNLSENLSILEANANISPEVVANETDPARIPLGEARLIRDTETKEVIEIVYGQMASNVKKVEEPEVPIIEELTDYLKKRARLSPKKTLTEIECHWLAGLYKKYSDDYEKMKWDRKLNPTFLSVGQLKRRMEMYHGMLLE